MLPIVGADVGYVVGAEFGASVGTAVCDFVGAEGGDTVSGAAVVDCVGAGVCADVGDFCQR